jgi:hypothetical protein
MFPDSSYEEGVVQLDPGDITCTDGVIEAANQSGEEWGVKGLLKATAAWARQGTENAEHLVRSVFNSMDDFSKGCQTDDVRQSESAFNSTLDVCVCAGYRGTVTSEITAMQIAIA